MRRIFRKFRSLRAPANQTLPPLLDSGERVIPDNSARGFTHVNFVRHKAAHLYAIRQLQGTGRVLDVGCGVGYGSALVAAQVREVVGIDVSEPSIARAKAQYRSENLKFAAMPATELDFPDGSFDAAYSIQVIEHIEDVELHLSEVTRVLRPGGRFIVATPNRLTYSPDGLHNPFHVKEYDARELESLLRSFFAEVEIVGLHAGLDLAFHPKAKNNEFGARVKALRTALEGAPELRQFMEEWLVEENFEGFNARSVGPHSFPVGPKSLDTSLDLLASCRKG